jgi:hypothetical protein
MNNIKEILRVNQVIKNYKEVCSILDIPEKTGQSRQLQIQDWQRYFKFDKDGQKYIIKEIFDVPIEKVNNTGKSSGSRGNNAIYVKFIESLLLHTLSFQNEHTLICTKNYLFLILGMVDSRYIDKKLRKTLIENKAFKDYELRDFDIRSYNILDRILFSALNSLQNRFLINWKQELHYTKFDESGNKIDCIANDIDEENYLSAKYKTAKEMGEEEGKPDKYDKLRDIFFYNKTDVFYDKLRDTLYDEYEWDTTSICYRIIFKKENVLDAIPRTERQLNGLVDKYKHELNDKIIIALNNNAQSRYDNQKKKYDDEYEELCDMNNTNYIPPELIKAFHPHLDYVRRQEMIAEELVKIRDRKKIKTA